MNIMNNIVLLVTIIVVVVFFFYYNQAKQPQQDTELVLDYTPDEESNLPQLPDYRHNHMVNQALRQTGAKFAAAYKECMAICGQQGGDGPQCGAMCKQVFDETCSKIDTECSAEMSNMTDLCVETCMNRGYPADQCTGYCNDAMNYLCSEMDEACQAGVTRVM